MTSRCRGGDMRDDVFNKFSKEVLNILEKEGEQTAYQLAKKLGVSWSTMISYLYKMKAEKLVKSRSEERLGSRKIFWSVNHKKSVSRKKDK